MSTYFRKKLREIFNSDFNDTDKFEAIDELQDEVMYYEKIKAYNQVLEDAIVNVSFDSTGDNLIVTKEFLEFLKKK